MPRRRADDSVKVPRNRYREFGLQADEILRSGVPVDDPCSHCVGRGVVCIMDSKSRNCASCTRRGRKCSKRFHGEQAWRRLNKDRDDLSSQIDEAEEQLEALFAKLKNLKTRRKFLEKRGVQMLDHDTDVMDQLNEENPLSSAELQELDRLATAHENAQLAAVSDDPNFSQVMAELDQMPPSFWEGLGSSAGGGTAEASERSPLSAQ